MPSLSLYYYLRCTCQASVEPMILDPLVMLWLEASNNKLQGNISSPGLRSPTNSPRPSLKVSVLLYACIFFILPVLYVYLTVFSIQLFAGKPEWSIPQWIAWTLLPGVCAVLAGKFFSSTLIWDDHLSYRHLVSWLLIPKLQRKSLRWKESELRRETCEDEQTQTPRTAPEGSSQRLRRSICRSHC